ncbi:DUF4177 domain-containing protein [Spirosoma daeguense]
MKRFEYRILDVSAGGFWGGKVDAQELTNRLNELGQEGWEVVSVVDTDIYGGGTKGLLVTLKRELI